MLCICKQYVTVLYYTFHHKEDVTIKESLPSFPTSGERPFGAANSATSIIHGETYLGHKTKEHYLGEYRNGDENAIVMCFFGVLLSN